MKYTSLLFVLILIALSCTKESELQIEFKGKNIVLVGILNPDSIININLSYSQALTELNGPEFVDNASVKIYKNDLYVQNLRFTQIKVIIPHPCVLNAVQNIR